MSPPFIGINNAVIENFFGSSQLDVEKYLDKVMEHFDFASLDSPLKVLYDDSHICFFRKLLLKKCKKLVKEIFAKGEVHPEDWNIVFSLFAEFWLQNVLVLHYQYVEDAVAAIDFIAQHLDFGDLSATLEFINPLVNILNGRPLAREHVIQNHPDLVGR